VLDAQSPSNPSFSPHAQTMADSRSMEYMRGRRIMEVNPDSPVIASLRAQVPSCSLTYTNLSAN